MRFLIVSYFYKPQISARAFRWGALAEWWVAQGHTVDVITSTEGSHTPQEQIGGVTIYRAESTLMRRLQAAQQSSGAVSTASANTAPSFIGQLLGWGYRNVWQRFLWPDAGFLWIRPAVRLGRQLTHDHQYDGLVTVSPFFSAHLVGERIRQAQQQWVMDYGDPFSLQQADGHNNVAFYASRNHRVERRLLLKADAVSVTTERTAEMYTEAFPAAAAKIHVIPPLAPATLSRHEEEQIFPQNEGIRLLYAGAFYPNIRRPAFLLRLFSSLVDEFPLELHIYGDISRVQADFEPVTPLIDAGRIVLHGTASRQRVRRAMCEVDVLINIGDRTAYQLPSKVVEYASTGQPILNLASIADDSSSRVLATYSNALTLFEGDSFTTNQQRLKVWLSNLPQTLVGERLQKWMAPYQLDAVGTAYDALVSPMTHTRN